VIIAPLHLPLSELVRRTVRETIDDDCLGLAAQVAYYLFLALFPAILFLLAVASFFPLDNLTDEIGRLLGPLVSAEVLQLIQDQMQRLANAESGGLLTFSVAGALWSSSAGLVSIVSALNRAYDIEEGRPWWRVRLVAIALTLGMAALILIALALVVVGPEVATYLGDRTGLGTFFTWTWLILQWPLVFAMASTAIGLAYYYGPDAEQEWVWITPGAILATVLWLLMSLAFRYYVATFTDYNASYGSIGGVIVLMLWFYISGLAILVGAEMNAEIEHASPYGKAPGQKTADGRRLLGRLAEVQFGKQQQSRPPMTAVEAPLVATRAAGPGLGGVLAAGVLPMRMWKRWRS
jgi:membrane protein